jgi:hypothetical protein
VAKQYRFEFLQLRRVVPHGYEVAVPPRFRPELQKFINLPAVQDGSTGVFEVNHRREQLPFMSRKSATDNYSYCQDMLHKMRSILPQWVEAGVTPIRSPETPKPQSFTRSTSLPVISSRPGA